MNLISKYAAFLTGGASDFLMPLFHRDWGGMNVTPLLQFLILVFCLAAVLCAVSFIINLGARRFMRALISMVAATSLVTVAYAASSTLSNLSAGGAVSGTDLFYDVQTPGSGGVKVTASQVLTYIGNNFSTFIGSYVAISAGCGNSTGAGAVTVGTINAALVENQQSTNYTLNVSDCGKAVVFTDASAVTLTLPAANSTGFATNYFTHVCNAAAGTLTLQPSSGTIGGLSSVTLAAATQSARNCAEIYAETSVGATDWGFNSFGGGGGGATGANPTATIGTSAVNGSASTFLRSDGAPAIPQCSSSTFGACKVDGTTITASSGVITAVGGGVTTGVCGISVSGVNVTGSLTPTILTGSNVPIIASYCGGLVLLNNSGAQTPTIAEAGTTGFPTGANFTLCNINTGAQTLTPGAGTIAGAASYVISAGTAAAPTCITLASDGVSDYKVVGGPVNVTLAGNNTFTGTNTFATVLGTETTQTTTYTFTSTDCGTDVRFTNSGAITATLPTTLPVGCHINVIQRGAGKVSVNGTAVTACTLTSAHSYTGTSGTAGSVIGIILDAANTCILTGDGS